VLDAWEALSDPEAIERASVARARRLRGTGRPGGGGAPVVDLDAFDAAGEPVIPRGVLRRRRLRPSYAIVHTHSPAATRWAHGEREPAPAVRTAVWAETATVELGAHAVAALGDRRAVLLARHGVVGVGAPLLEALAVCENVEQLAGRRQAMPSATPPPARAKEERGCNPRRAARPRS
jgi:hypothetical protein